MKREHSFFIPDREHLTDVAGLLAYLGEKIVVGNICIYCPDGGKEFGSLSAVRKHMADKAHCKLAYRTSEDLAEVSDFYDYPFVKDEEAGWEDVEMASDHEGDIVDNFVVSVTPCKRLTLRTARHPWLLMVYRLCYRLDELLDIVPFEFTIPNILGLKRISVKQISSSCTKLLKSESAWPIQAKR